MVFGSLFKPQGLDYANKMTERNLNRTLALGQQQAATARGIYGDQEEAIASGQRQALSQLGASYAAAGQEMRDQSAQFMGQLLAQKGSTMLNPAAFMAATQAQTVKGLRSLYGSAGKDRAGIAMNTAQMNVGALGNLGDKLLASTRSQQEALSSVQYEVGASPFEEIAGAAASIYGVHKAFE